MLIKGRPSATLKQMQKWAESKKATPLFIELAEVFYNLSIDVGVNPVIVYAQSAKETGYGRFGGVLNASYHNPCGLKTSTGGGDKDINAHMKFNNWIDGINAQIDHLALYAGLNGYPKADTTDPRHFPYLFGTAPTVEDLGGKWAGSLTYGTDIVKIMKDIEDTIVEEVVEIVEFIDIENHWAEEEIEFIVEKGELKGYNDNTFRPEQPLTRAEYCVLRARQLGFVKKKIIPKPDVIPYSIDHIPKSDKRPELAMDAISLTIHSTANPKSTAKNERAWLTNPSNTRVASYHIVVDDKEAIECLPLNEVAWHAGDGFYGKGNRKSISIEICESGDREKTLQNAAIIAAKILRDQNISILNIKRHFDWSGKNCPRIFSVNNWKEWYKFIERVKQA